MTRTYLKVLLIVELAVAVGAVLCAATIDGNPWPAIAGAAVAGAIASLAILRMFARPVRTFRDVAHALAEGDLSARIGRRLGNRHGPLGRLGHDLDAMADHLQRLIESRQRLLRDVSHELRSPLARIRVALALAERGDGGSSQELRQIERETVRLDRLIGHILELARLETVGSEPMMERFDLSELVAGVAADAAVEAEARGRMVTWESPGTVEVTADPSLIRSAVDNVMRNAVRYTADGTGVRVAIDASRDDRVVIAVRDRGPGVPEADLDKIFDPFYRVEASRRRDSGGDGIGLAITARSVERHGGVVRARNAPDGGLIVEISLPR